MSKETSKDLRNLFIYQVYVRNYSDEGTFNALKEDLSRIKDLGVDIVYLLPVHPIGEVNRKGKLGSPYSIKDYYGINPELGTLEDFKTLINEIHQMDMLVMMDIVFNHTSHDSLLLKNHPEYFYKKNGEFANKVGDWWDITDLDFTNKGLWKELIDILLYWSQLGIDAFRFDVASLLPLDFLMEMREAVLKQNPKTIFLSESVHGGFCRYLRNQGIDCLSESEIYQVFDISYDYDIQPYFEGFLKGEVTFTRYLEELYKQEEIYPDNYIKLRNLENHDYGRFAKFVDSNILKIKQWLALTFFSKGASMIYAGQEFCDDHLPDLFNKDVVDWEGPNISDFIKSLHQITNQKIRSHGAYEINIQDKEAYIGHYQLGDQLMVGIFNIGLEYGRMNVPLSDGTYINELNNKEVVIKNKQVTLIEEPIIIID